MNLDKAPQLTTRLHGSRPSWTEDTDVVVVGSGVAGLTCALNLRESGFHVTVVTKVEIDDGSTRWAQGGVAAVLDPADSPESHAYDTSVAGVGLCDPEAVRVTVSEGPDELRKLINAGARFDRDDDGALQLTREGGHRARRIVHAGGDATGAEIQRALHTAVLRDPWIRVIEHAMVLELLQDDSGHAAGVTLHILGEGVEHGVGSVRSRAVVLATGGLGQIYQNTTNPAVSIGDGVALALRAGAEVCDLEFVQFHPTALYLDDHEGRAPLISEALRGEGAHLLDGDQRRFMTDVHELAELAPRDVVAKASTARMRDQDRPHVWIDARHLGETMLTGRFPTITAICRDHGIDPARDLVPVAPAAHYSSGGVACDLDGMSTIPGLYAAGEVARTGLHGANRLASNSLLEGLVFSRRIAQHIAKTQPEPGPPLTMTGHGRLVHHDAPGRIRQAMTEGAGVLRSADSLTATLGQLARAGAPGPPQPKPDTWEATNLHTAATAVAYAAGLRRETRGSHWRNDHPDASPIWLGNLHVKLKDNGRLSHEFRPLQERPHT
ncbi:L-aspartate oxidase [Haloglycomyces albus]|uniref:L-aspartate oxidase n=1 Tax=Haloglycomyces albus TaxID=526067 RepID=UPI00046D42C0|nr:L-aspartate oxidase [Haloglycomyces albus]